MLRRSTRPKQAPKKYNFIFEIDVLPIDDEPNTYEEAIPDIDFDKWNKAKRIEMDAMHVNQVWTLMDQPDRIKPVGYKWILKKKFDMDGNVQGYAGCEGSQLKKRNQL